MITRLWISIAGAVALLTAFQNCSTTDTSRVTPASQSSNSPTPSPSPTGVAQAFTAGQAFNYALVSNASQMVSAQLTDAAYSASTFARAVAVSSTGLGYVAVATDGNQAEANQRALESCFAISGSQPCALLATGNTFALNANDLLSTATYTFSITANTAFSGTSTPFLTYADRATAFSDYAGATAPKAMAISLDGTFMIAAANGLVGTLTDSRSLISGQSSPNVPATQAEAQRMALELCEMMSKYLPCTLYAGATAVVLDPAAFNYAPQINYAPATLTEVPGIAALVFKNNIKPGLSGNTITISADGDGGDSSSGTTALNQCQSNQAISNTGTYPCFTYAVGQTLHMTSANLSALHLHSLATHCQIMPRTSCAAHAAVGCTGGTFYTVSAGGVPVLSTCN